jgi:hypothetical protein
MYLNAEESYLSHSKRKTIYNFGDRRKNRVDSDNEICFEELVQFHYFLDMLNLSKRILAIRKLQFARRKLIRLGNQIQKRSNRQYLD